MSDASMDLDEPEAMSAYQMDGVCENVLGMSYARAAKDESGCYIGKVWLSPKKVVEAIELALNKVNISLDQPEPEEEDDDE